MSNTVASNAKATQEFVPIKEIRDGVVILKDGSMRALVMASSVNFALKSNDEQQAILSQFQNFVNSLNFSIEIFVQSRRLDIRPYLALLESKYKEQTSELLKIQTREYIGFVKSFTETTNVMTKTFYVVTPYSPSILFLYLSLPMNAFLIRLSIPIVCLSFSYPFVPYLDESYLQLDQLPILD